jgi:hypothetical protein
MEKKGMKKKIILFILIIVFIYAGGGVLYALFNKNSEAVAITNLDSISGYDYTLKSNASSLYESEFKILKANLESGDVDGEEYAKSIAKLFIIDLYTLSNKVNKYDIGGSEFVHPDYLANYKLNVEDTLYKYLEDNTNNNRTQELPEVSTINIITCEKTNYAIDDNSFEGHSISLEWSYVQDLGYDSSGEIILIKLDNTYVVVEKN